ncbi:hypothetical protein Tco_0080465 [Tanacetum coccineum]
MIVILTMSVSNTQESLNTKELKTQTRENVEACDAHSFLKTDFSSPWCLRNHKRLSPRIQQQRITPLVQTGYQGLFLHALRSLILSLCHCLLTSSFHPRSLNLYPLVSSLPPSILYLDQHAHTLHHLKNLLTISLDRLDIMKEDLLYQSLRKSLSLNLELS